MVVLQIGTSPNFFDYEEISLEITKTWLLYPNNYFYKSRIWKHFRIYKNPRKAHFGDGRKSNIYKTYSRLIEFWKKFDYETGFW